ncbi:5-oxoprolinase subunit PxpB [Neolewinella agarilytica]|uniref:Sensor histidine kinase inhibitor, KipI family n=1 Tax=Neolewinella agarilytica TaxID=478744 RepID=A0A1H9MTR4_9BACT|nr:5-oxoprolinase subunit PxpB [Neolewinella agarilytica]SER26795.1 sensor histidine kinase inhibitor, KipI family [Neolewinella agarilytica]
MRLPREIISYGPTALLLNWEQLISPAISSAVHRYTAAIEQVRGVQECIPAYASLLVCFDAQQITPYQLKEIIFTLQPEEVEATGIRHEIPVCYEPSLAPDLLTAAETLELSTDELIGLHTNKDYLVYQLGYQPGFAFLGETDERLAIDRRASPRRSIPEGSVGLAGRQTGIYPTAGPGGWQIIGRCPWPMLGDGDDWSRLQAGDQVCFYAIGPDEFHQLQKTAAPWPVR